MENEKDEICGENSRKRSGAIIGAENVQRLKEYLEQLAATSRGLPSLRGRVNVSAIALACGFERSVLYQNPSARQVLEAAAATLGLDAHMSKRVIAQVDPRDQRIQKLEQEGANKSAEIFELRRALRRFEHIEEVMIETGKRVV